MRALLIAMATATAMMSVAACTAGGDRTPSAAASAAGTPALMGAPAPTAAASVATTAEMAAIKATIDAINATAGGPVSRQRAELQHVVTPGQLAKQRACPAAHSTLAFQPAYHDLRLAPRGSSSSSAVSAATGSGTAYLLPAFITIYTGDRITGTDLTTLRLWVTGDTARTAALCVS